MIVNFSQIDLNDRPILILKRADSTPIGVLGNAKNVELEPKYNELSVLTFELPARVDGVDTPFYEEVTGQKIIELKDIGQFVVSSPEETGDKINRAIKVSANSLEHEFMRKKITLPESTYKFFDTTNADGTILDMVMELMPNWTVGSVSSTLYNKYRTFEISNENLYNFIKGTLQKAYNCIVDFDTLNRTVNVRDADETPAQRQVFISRENLAKDIQVTERTDDLVTRLDMNGADGVDIREVNPTGDNVIVNLDYFMNTNNFSQALVDKYNSWKSLVETNRLPFYNYAIQYSMLVAEETTENAKLVDLQGEYTSLENIQAVIIQGIAQKIKTQADLDVANANLAAKQAEIDAKQAEIDSIASERESTMASIKAIRDACAYENYFTLAERKTLDPYIIDNAITETSFVASEVQSYTDGAGNNIVNKAVTATNATVTETTSASGSHLYSITGGTANIAGLVTGTIINAIFERRPNGKIVLNMYIGAGTYNGTTFPSACVSISGDGSISHSGTSATCNITDGYLYFSLNASDYEKKTVAWELYEYGIKLLEKMAVPSYSFSVSSANFIALKEFELFKNELELGQRIYIEVNNGRILQPICTGAHIKWSDRAYLDLQFNDTFTANDGEAKLVEILDTSISTGKTLSAGKYTYEAWTDSGASTELRDFILSSLDTAKNAILSSTEQAVSWDGAGLRLRRYKNDAHTAYENEQIWMSNNSIMMTDDGWATAKMAIGKFTDDNLGEKWGVIAPMVVGTLLAGEELVIEAAKQSGDTTVFRVDADGCRLYNAEFTIQKTNTGGTTTQILLNPDVGIAMGTYPVTNNDGSINETNAKFYVDPAGTMHLAGSIYSNDGYIGNWNINGSGLWSGSGQTYVGLSSSGTYRIWAGDSTADNAPFSVQEDGTLKSTKGTIGNWYIGDDYIGNADTKTGSTVGLASGTDNATVSFWAGGKQAVTTGESGLAKFRVLASGKVYASDIEITGGSITIKDSNGVTTFSVNNQGAATASNMTITGGSITISNGGVTRFSVSSTGKVAITDGSISIKSGDTVMFSVSDVGYLLAQSGKIGNWHIGTDYIGNKNTKANSTVGMVSSDTATDVVFWAGSANPSTTNKAPFMVTANGALYSTSAEITGKIIAKTGQVGGWHVSETHIGSAETAAASAVGLSNVSGNTVAIWAGSTGDKSVAAFRVTGGGAVYATNMNITGGSIRIEKNGATTFSVTSEGAVSGSDITITGGSITLKNGSAIMFSVDTNGYLTANSGKVGGWFISSEHIGSGSDKATSTVGLANDTGTNKVFWAGTNKFQVLADGTLKSSAIEVTGGSISISLNGTVMFAVNPEGAMTAKSGTIGGWHIGSDYIGNANTKAGSSVGMASVAGNSTNKAFWAGGTTPLFSVTGAGYLSAASGVIGTKSTGDDRAYIEISGGKISIDCNATTLTSAGVFTTTSGKIGGWSISNIRMKSGSGSGYVALDSDDTLTNPNAAWNRDTNDWVQPYAIVCGSSNFKKAPFRVRRDGIVYIQALYVDGQIIDFSTFENAVSLAAGGSWSGNTFTATVSLWGKINKTINIGASARITGASISTPTTDGYSILDANVEYSVNDVPTTRGLQYTLLNVNNAIQVGYEKGKTEFEPYDIVEDTPNIQISVRNSSGVVVGGPYDVPKTYKAGADSVTLSSDGITSNSSYISYSSGIITVPCTANLTNGKKPTDSITFSDRSGSGLAYDAGASSVTLNSSGITRGSPGYSNGTVSIYCTANLTNGGRPGNYISYTDGNGSGLAYDAGSTAGYNSAKVYISRSGNVLSAAKSSTDQSPTSVTITSSSGTNYQSDTHTYKITSHAYVDGVEVYSIQDKETTDRPYQDGKTDGAAEEARKYTHYGPPINLYYYDSGDKTYKSAGYHDWYYKS